MKALFVTGAGISASAGIPTYREGSSSWRDKDLEKKSHATRYGNHLDELWDKHWGPVKKQMDLASPTRAHKAIAEFQKNNPSIIATQNIDDLHERAGSDSVAHVHGTMNIRCMKCKKEADSDGYTGSGAPVCVRCGFKKTRPDVVLFGEMLDQKLFKALEHWAFNEISHLIVVGSSLNVYPIAGLVMDCLSKNIHTVLINKGEAQFSRWFKEVHDAEADLVIEDVLASLKES